MSDLHSIFRRRLHDIAMRTHGILHGQNIGKDKDDLSAILINIPEKYGYSHGLDVHIHSMAIMCTRRDLEILTTLEHQSDMSKYDHSDNPFISADEMDADVEDEIRNTDDQTLLEDLAGLSDRQLLYYMVESYNLEPNYDYIFSKQRAAFNNMYNAYKASGADSGIIWERMENIDGVSTKDALYVEELMQTDMYDLRAEQYDNDCILADMFKVTRSDLKKQPCTKSCLLLSGPDGLDTENFRQNIIKNADTILEAIKDRIGISDEINISASVPAGVVHKNGREYFTMMFNYPFQNPNEFFDMFRAIDDTLGANNMSDGLKFSKLIKLSGSINPRLSTKEQTALDKWIAAGGTEAEFRKFQEEAQYDADNGLDSPLSDGHYEALGLQAPGM